MLVEGVFIWVEILIEITDQGRNPVRGALIELEGKLNELSKIFFVTQVYSLDLDHGFLVVIWEYSFIVLSPGFENNSKNSIEYRKLGEEPQGVHLLD